jgi:hypothetical protein
MGIRADPSLSRLLSGCSLKSVRSKMLLRVTLATAVSPVERAQNPELARSDTCEQHRRWSRRCVLWR